MQIFKTSKILTISAIVLSTTILSACFGGSSEPSRYYTIAAESIQMPQAATSSARLQVRKFTIDPAYKRSNIVYRESPYDFMFYDLDLWATRPEQMMTQVASEYFIKSNLFKAVDLKPVVKPEYELIGHIDAIEEVDEGSAQFAHVAMQLTFRKVDGEAPLWEKRYDDKMSMDKREPRFAAEAASKLVGKFMEDAIKEIGESIAK